MPLRAVPGAIRKAILQEWRELGLKAEPNTGDNGVHAAAGAFHYGFRQLAGCWVTQIVNLPLV